MNRNVEMEFLHLFERVSEPLYFSPRGRDDTALVYNVPTSTISCTEIRHASTVTRSAFANSGARAVSVAAPTSMPNLSNIGNLCPRTALYSYFNREHRSATKELRDIFMQQQSLEQLLAMACACRDSPQINCKLWINSFASVMLHHRQTRNFRMPAIWEVMPDQFFGASALRQAYMQVELPPEDRAVIRLDPTGSRSNPESRLAYWREDVGMNSHHWHWHLIYRLDDAQLDGRRKGELFYYMHHAMIARYDAERLGHGMKKVRPFIIDDNPRVKEGYFGKLFITNSGLNWGTRQNDTPLQNLNRQGDNDTPVAFRQLTLAQLRQWRDRIQEAIDTGRVMTPNGQRMELNIDILGDIMEASTLNPNPRFYGADGFHNAGHAMLALAHDPDFHHFEKPGPMFETTTAMRDPVFYQWHKYIDILFDMYKQTLQPYQDRGGEFPLVWENISVTNIQTQTTNFGSTPNVLRTYWQESHVDMSRGLDFMRTDMNRLGAIWLRFAHLNHDEFNYTITVRNNTRSATRATVRIFMAPRMNENGERYVMDQQRKLFFELDKFTEEIRPGEHRITRKSTDSSVTVPWEQTFRQLERNTQEPNGQQVLCGCGWPQHLLLPRGSAGQGQLFDLVVFLTSASEDQVPGTGPTQGANCRESLSFCGRLNQAYPDRKPMGYPFDRNPYTVQNPSDPRGPQIPVQSLEEYIQRIPNMHAIQVRITHDPNRKEVRPNDGPTGQMRFVDGNPFGTRNPTRTCPGTGGSGAASGSASSSISMTSASRPSTMTSTSASSSSSGGSPGGGRTSPNTNGQWGQPRQPSRPSSPPRESWPNFGNWGWQG